MESLIAGILEYSRVGRQSNAFEKIDSGKLAHETVEFLSPPETFTVSVQENMPVIYADKLKMQQVLSNLISNAVKYHHTKNGSILIACKDVDDHYHFSVTDDGPGIDPQYHKKVFDIFQTLQARDKIESTGIGLAIVKKIIEEGGGTIWVESELGHGTSFVFSWPKEANQTLTKKKEKSEHAEV
jgi:signal transduction histidine kinase